MERGAELDDWDKLSFVLAHLELCYTEECSHKSFDPNRWNFARRIEELEQQKRKTPEELAAERRAEHAAFIERQKAISRGRK